MYDKMMWHFVSILNLFDDESGSSISGVLVFLIWLKKRGEQNSSPLSLRFSQKLWSLVISPGS